MAAVIKASAQRGKCENRFERTREQAAQILANAEYHAEQIRVEAARNAYRDAEHSARELARQQVDALVESLAEAIRRASDGLLEAKDAWKKHWETRAVQLAIAIAERVIRREIERTPQITLALVREALELAAGNHRIKLRLHSQAVELLGNSLEKVSAGNADINSVEIVIDDTVSCGGCIVETESGEIDQQIETQLARIEEELT